MPFIVGVLKHTPIWVYLLLVYLVWQGIQSLTPRDQPLWRLMIVPAVFIVIGLSGIVLRHEASLWLMLSWLAGAALFAPLGLSTGPKLLAVDRENGRVTRAGSPIPLVRNIVVFLLQYIAAVISATRPDAHLTAALVGRAISGASAGYFIGWIVAVLQRYREAPKPAQSS